MQFKVNVEDIINVFETGVIPSIELVAYSLFAIAGAIVFNTICGFIRRK